MSRQRVNIISLGCPRNLVDSEVVLGLLQQAHVTITDTVEGADTIIVNTCGFIEDAKKESIDVILGLIDLKQRGNIKHIIVSGCLAQRYKTELPKELKEVDAFLGVGNIENIVEVVQSLNNEKTIIDIAKQPTFLYSHTSPRLIMTPAHYAYIKIQEGCSNRCSYCVIPQLRGAYRSRPMHSIIQEADTLLNRRNSRITEINVIGQDTTSYGIDRYRKAMLPALLRRLTTLLKREVWLRLLYTHPAHFSNELIEVIRDYPICKYIDLPIQHINNTLLKRMNRGVTQSRICALIEKIRKKLPGIVVRTSIIVGFPGETEAQFDELLLFLKNIKFERLGAFIYSREEGTHAARLQGHIPQAVKNRRFDRVMRLQQSIAQESNRKFLHTTVRVLVDKKAEAEDNLFLARTQGDAPDVDGTVYLKTPRATIGSFVNARIIDTLEYDLVGEVAP
jgi:ribosomal protein S12 methylthiotransferase